jgi:hypothetical protein
MSAAMSEPSTEYTLAAPAVCAKKDSMRSLLHFQHSKAANTTTGTHIPEPAPTSSTLLPLKSLAFIDTAQRVTGAAAAAPGALACAVIDASAHDILEHILLRPQLRVVPAVCVAAAGRGVGGAGGPEVLRSAVGFRLRGESVGCVLCRGCVCCGGCSIRSGVHGKG